MSNMRPGLIGRKIGMTQIYDDSGDVIPVTVIESGPNYVVRLKTVASVDGYDSVQLGFLNYKASRLTQPEIGHLEKNDVPPRALPA